MLIHAGWDDGNLDIFVQYPKIGHVMKQYAWYGKFI
jgi:hypothetical protein